MRLLQYNVTEDVASLPTNAWKNESLAFSDTGEKLGGPTCTLVMAKNHIYMPNHAGIKVNERAEGSAVRATVEDGRASR